MLTNELTVLSDAEIILSLTLNKNYLPSGKEKVIQNLNSRILDKMIVFNYVKANGFESLKKQFIMTCNNLKFKMK
jgi:hypothetical protein